MNSYTRESIRSSDEGISERSNFKAFNPIANHVELSGQIEIVVDFILADILPDAALYNLLILGVIYARVIDSITE